MSGLEHWRILRVLALLIVPGLVACDDGTGPNRLAGEDVAGIYTICDLRFTPEGVPPAVDIRTAGFNLSTSQDIIAPRLAVDVLPTFQLRYTPKDQNSFRTLEGSYTLRAEAVTLRFQSGVTPSALLLPDQVDLEFQSRPLTLSTPSSASYTVPRADYARLAGISESGLAERIPGRLSAVFRVGGCG